jgi:hypothetical protein
VVAARVPWQPAIEAIANTIKHAAYHDAGWPMGIAGLASFVPELLQAEMEACSDGIELFKFRHRHRDDAWWDIALRQHSEDGATPGYVAFGDTLEQWEAVLGELGYKDE